MRWPKYKILGYLLIIDSDSFKVSTKFIENSGILINNLGLSIYIKVFKSRHLNFISHKVNLFNFLLRDLSIYNKKIIQGDSKFYSLKENSELKWE